MVFKSERNIEKTTDENNNIGPGEYLPLSSIKKFTINKEPFLTSSPRSKIEIKDTPGPGAYYHDETFINYLKNLEKEKISKQNDKTNLLTKGINGNLSKICFLMNTEKKGFNMKSKRFKILNTSDDPPGPGKYFKEKKNKKKSKLQKLKENEIFLCKKFNIIKSNEFLKIPTIPSKENIFGFDILNNGTLIQKQNPDNYKTFSGEKGDTVGPGTYEIEKPNNWLKTGTSWSKLRTVRDCNKNDFSTSLSTTNYSESKNNYNISHNNKTTGRNSKDFTQASSFDLNNRTNFHNPKKTNKKTLLNLIVTNCKINNKKKCKKIRTFESVIKNVEPGPGYYYNPKTYSSFKAKYLPEMKQFFGSKLSRFDTKNILSNSLGPGTYFKQEKALVQMNKTSSAFAPFSSSVERFVFSEEKQKEPGPGNYNIPNLEKNKKLSNSSEGKFGSKEIRFYNMYNMNWKNEIPGPGFYEIKKEVSMSNVDKNNSKKGKVYNNAKNDLEKHSNIKIQNLITNGLKEDEIPPIGIYNPGIIDSIDYKIRKKVYESRNKNIAFTTTFNKKKNKKNIDIDCEEANLGPGYYYREKKRKDNKLSAVFHLPEFKTTPKINTMVGPGQYNLDSYNDWTKKSFNIHYI